MSMSGCPDYTRKAIQEAAKEIGIIEMGVKISEGSDALAELPTAHLPTSDQTLVDRVEEAIGGFENCTNKGKRSSIDMNKPFGKLKGVVLGEKRSNASFSFVFGCVSYEWLCDTEPFLLLSYTCPWFRPFTPLLCRWLVTATCSTPAAWITLASCAATFSFQCRAHNATLPHSSIGPPHRALIASTEIISTKL